MVMALAGCGQLSPKMYADTPESFQSSLRKYTASGEGLPSKERAELVNAIRGLYLTEDGQDWKPLDEDQLPAGIFHGLRMADFPRMARRLLGQPGPDGDLYAVQAFDPSDPLSTYWVNDFFLKQLKAQHGILLARKERSRQTDLFTIDQLAFAEAAFIPPQDGQPIAQDYARFTVKLLNNTLFNLYRPEFRVSVSDSRSPRPIIDLVLKHESDEPMAPGQVTQVVLQCCDGFRAEAVNQALRTLRPDARTSMHLVGIEDYRKRNVIENVMFTSEQHLRLVATERCIKEVQANLSTWTADESRGGCAGI